MKFVSDGSGSAMCLPLSVFREIVRTETYRKFA